MEATGYAVLLIAIVCGVAALVGGDVSLPGGAKFPKLSLAVRIALALVTFVLLVAAVAFIVVPRVGTGTPPPSTSERPSHAGPCVNPKISLSKGKGSSGTKVTITGTGFPSLADVTTRFHTEAMAPARSDEKGTFEGKVVIPGSFDPFAPQQFDIVASTTSPTVCNASTPFQLTD